MMIPLYQWSLGGMKRADDDAPGAKYVLEVDAETALRRMQSQRDAAIGQRYDRAEPTMFQHEVIALLQQILLRL